VCAAHHKSRTLYCLTLASIAPQLLGFSWISARNIVSHLSCFIAS
jgi:hypothetical protein